MKTTRIAFSNEKMVTVINEMIAQGYKVSRIESNHNHQNVTEVTHKLVFVK